MVIAGFRPAGIAERQLLVLLLHIILLDTVPQHLEARLQASFAVPDELAESGKMKKVKGRGRKELRQRQAIMARKVRHKEKVETLKKQAIRSTRPHLCNRSTAHLYLAVFAFNRDHRVMLSRKLRRQSA